MDRVVSALLAELDQLDSQTVVIGATNRPDLIDPALLRPGRFDRLVYLGPAQTEGERLCVLKALTRKLALAPDCDLEEVARMLPGVVTGADIGGVVGEAAMAAVARVIEAVEAGERREVPIVTVEDFRSAVSRERVFLMRKFHRL